MKIILCDTAFNISLKVPQEPPLGLSAIASFLRSKEYSVAVLCPNLEKWNIKRTAKVINKNNPEIVGFSIIDVNAVKAIRLVKYLRKLGYKGYIVLGGNWPSLNSNDILRNIKEVDACIRGEGEFAMLEVVESLNSQKDFKHILGLSYKNGSDIVENRSRPLIENLDNLPNVARDYTAQLIRLGGTPAIYAGKRYQINYSFSSKQTDYEDCLIDNIQIRTPKNIIDEVEIILRTFGISHFSIVDDNFIMPSKKGTNFITNFIEEIVKRKLKINFDLTCGLDLIDKKIFGKLKIVGLKRVFVRIESPHENDLKRINKKIAIAAQFSVRVAEYDLN